MSNFDKDDFEELLYYRQLIPKLEKRIRNLKEEAEVRIIFDKR